MLRVQNLSHLIINLKNKTGETMTQKILNKVTSAICSEVKDASEQFMSSRLGLAFKRNTGSIQTTALLGVMAVSALAGSHDAFAGTAAAGTTDSFDSVWTAIVDFSKGSGGKLLTGLFVVVGVAAGIMKGSLMGFVAGIGAGIGLYNMEAIIDGLFGATLDHVPASVDAVKQIANGLMKQ